ncbi:unnamed protein product [Lota lota]
MREKGCYPVAVTGPPAVHLTGPPCAQQGRQTQPLLTVGRTLRVLIRPQPPLNVPPDRVILNGCPGAGQTEQIDRKRSMGLRDPTFPSSAGQCHAREHAHAKPATPKVTDTLSAAMYAGESERTEALPIFRGEDRCTKSITHFSHSG